MHTRLLIAFSLLASATSLKAGWFGPDNYAECMSEAINGKTGLSLKYALEGARVRCFKVHCEGRLVTTVVRTREESRECLAAKEKMRAEEPRFGYFSYGLCEETEQVFKDSTCP